MTEQSPTEVTAIAIAGGSPDGSPVSLAFAAPDGQTIAFCLGQALAERLANGLQAALAVGQPFPRRRYLDIKPGGLRGS